MLEQLKGIKSAETITLDLMPYFISLTLFILTLVGIILFFTLRKKKKQSNKQRAIAHLKAMDLNTLEDKQIAYQFCAYGHECLEEHYRDEFIKIERQLEGFKYKKEVPKLDNELKSQIADYIKVRL